MLVGAPVTFTDTAIDDLDSERLAIDIAAATAAFLAQ